MRRVLSSVVPLLVALVLSGCDEGVVSPLGPNADLIGYWFLTPGGADGYGFYEGQFYFGPEGQLSLYVQYEPGGDHFTLAGSWSRAGDLVTLRVGPDIRTWRVSFSRPTARFEEQGTGASFTIHRALPD